MKWQADMLVRGGRVIDPGNRRDEVADVLIKSGTIAQVGSGIRSEDGIPEIDVGGLVVTPGFIDTHVHLREPGFEHKETIASGSRSAAAGGFTSIVAMPNTDPPLDTPGRLLDFQRRVEATSVVRAYPIACITAGRGGRAIAPLRLLADAGAVAYSDDGDPVEDEEIMRAALSAASRLDKPIFPHEEVKQLTVGGCMHEGEVSARLGVKGMPAAAEEEMIARDIGLVRDTGGPLHIAHISTRGSAELVRAAKSEGLPVTCEVLPHHFVLTDEEVVSQGTAAKMSPPLRTRGDVEAMLTGLADGTIDAISTDHAPHTAAEKTLPLERAPFGIVGLETALGLTLTYLVNTGVLDLMSAIDKWTLSAARILRLPGGRLDPGAPGDLTIMDPKESWQVDAESFQSSSKNTPFDRITLFGRATASVVGGELVFSRMR
jgi:dihydroorotase